MAVWAQSSQRATCPPRAAVRQLSMALITFNWSRLRCAVGMTPCGPVAAEDVRDLQSWTVHGGPALCRRPLLRQRQPLERAHHRAQHVGGDMGIAGGRVQLGMAQAVTRHNEHLSMSLKVKALLSRIGC